MAYDELPEEVKHLLAPLPVKLVPRNAGIDAIADQFIDRRPVLIRVQRAGENLAAVARKLRLAGQSRSAALLVLIQTSDGPPSQINFGVADDLTSSNLVVVPATSFALQQVLEQWQTASVVEPESKVA